MIANPFIALTGTGTREDIESCFKPIVPALRNLHRFVQLMFIGENVVDRGLETFKREIAMKLDHSAPSWNRVGPIDLNLVVALPIERHGRYHE